MLKKTVFITIVAFGLIFLTGICQAEDQELQTQQYYYENPFHIVILSDGPLKCAAGYLIYVTEPYGISAIQIYARNTTGTQGVPIFCENKIQAVQEKKEQSDQFSKVFW